MSHAPFDGVFLDDPRPPIPGALALVLHLRVAGHPEGHGVARVQARALACQELLAHGLFPSTLRDLRQHGLPWGQSKDPQSLASLVAHLEAYLAEVARAGYLEPDLALWEGVSTHLEGKRGLWIERHPHEGPLCAGIREMTPTRLRALACVPELGGATFALATRKGDGCSGLFGSSQPLVAWFMEGLESYGWQLPNTLELIEPPGWGVAPWISALERLFEGPLALDSCQHTFRRALVDGPADLLRHAVEQVCAWIEAGLSPQDITLIHPDPPRFALSLAPLLAAEGLELHVRGGLLPLIHSASWSPFWNILKGIERLDPCRVSAGLGATTRPDLRAWAEALAQADQNGSAPFERALEHLGGASREGARSLWHLCQGLPSEVLSAAQWADRLESLAGALRLPLDPDDFYGALGMLREAWQEHRWTYVRMLASLQAFLQAARATRHPQPSTGLRLVAPSAVLDDWHGAKATLVLDLSEGAWPALPTPLPDLDGARKAAINQALLAAAKHCPPDHFSPALQRFWLPRSEGGDQIPRTFQREAYGFNKVLAMTSEQLVVLSPAQDGDGRAVSQGPFWSALEGAALWSPTSDRAASMLRWRWEEGDRDPLEEARANAAQARSVPEAILLHAPQADLIPDGREAWMRGSQHVSPTALEGLARCPFRSMAERIWRLDGANAIGHVNMAIGTLTHRLLEAMLRPFLDLPNWPPAALAAWRVADDDDQASVQRCLEEVWETQHRGWFEALVSLPGPQQQAAASAVVDLMPHLASALLLDATAKGPDKWETAFLWPEILSLEEAQRGSRKQPPLQDGWTRTLLHLESELGPVDLFHEGEGHLPIAGKVDRLERWDGPSHGLAFLRVTDYKTSKKGRLASYAADEAPFGSHLQPSVYMLLAEAQHGVSATSVLVPLKDENPEPYARHLERLACAEGGWRERLRQRVSGLFKRIETGDFPPTPGEACAFCPFSALCGRPVEVSAPEDDA